MNTVSRLALVSSALLAASCGGEDSPSPPPSTPAPVPPPTLTVNLSKTSETITLKEGESATFGFEATYSGTSSQPVVADITIPDTRVAPLRAPSANGNTFKVDLGTIAYPAGGEQTTEITFRLCTSANCSTVYPGSTRTLTLTLDVQLEDWEMFQRNAAHTGYVAVNFDASRFAKAWDRPVKEGLDALPIAAASDTIYVVEGKDNIPATANIADRILALNTADGDLKWTSDLKEYSTISGPTLSNNLLLVTAYDSAENIAALLMHDASTGARIDTGASISQYGGWMQPTAFGGRAFVAAGLYGNQVFAFDLATRSGLWQSFGSRGVTDGQSVAADVDSIYYYSGTGIDVFDPASGALKRTIANQFYTGGGYGWESALLLDGSGGIYGMNGHREWPYSGNSIVGYSTSSNQARWVTADRSYFAHPALSSGHIYALRSNARELHAIDTRDGTVAWKLNIPGTGALRYNVVATANLLFVSTETDVYAFDISKPDRPMVWSEGVAGSLAITPNNFLIVSGPDTITAFRLY